MARPLAGVVQFLRARLGRAPGQSSDGQLLDRFLTEADGAAFAALMERHAGLVWQVCRRVLGDAADVDDAFQATFLVLLRKADSLDRQRSLANWLYGVAYRVALKAREKGARRRRRERQVDDMNALARDSSADAELRAVLDGELARLPDKLRGPLVLCYLQGKTNEQAADELGLPAGSMSKRLAQGRELLRERLNQRGLAYSSAVLATALASEANAAAPATLVRDTCEALIAVAAGRAAPVSAASELLAKRVLRNMIFDRIKLMTVAAMLASVLILGAGLAHQAWRTQAASFVPAPAEPVELPLARQPRLPLRPESTQIPGERNDTLPLIQVGVFPEAAFQEYARTIKGEAPPRARTLAGPQQCLQLHEPRAGQPIAVLAIGPRLNSGEAFQPVLLTRHNNTFTLVLETWRDNGGRAKNIITHGVHLLELGTLAAGDYQLRIIARDMFLDYQQPLPRYSRQVSEEAGSLSFHVLAAAAPMPKVRDVPMLERGKLQPRALQPKDKERNLQHTSNGNVFAVPGANMPAASIALHKGNFMYEAWQLNKMLDKLPASATKTDAQTSMHLLAFGPELDAGEWLELGGIEWQGNQARVHVNVWRDDGPRRRNIPQQHMVVVNLGLPQQEVAPNTVGFIPGKYEVVVAWTSLQAATPAQPYVVGETKTTTTTFTVE